jgi:hypothetical protein
MPHLKAETTSVTSRFLRGLAAGLTALAIAAPAALAQGTPDYFSTDNIEHVGQLKEAGDGVGARIIGKTMFVTSTTHLLIYDITDAESPKRLGALTMDVEFENEDVPTNGKILGISGSISASCDPGETDCLNLYDVSDPAAPKKISSVGGGAGAHTSECVLDCTWFYGSEGQIVDARDPKDAKLLKDKWTSMVTDQGYEFTNSPHAIREVSPGYLITSSNPSFLLSVRPEHGASPDHPVVLASGAVEGRFIHSAEWPRDGRDKFLLIGGETVLDAQQCTDRSAAFMTWDAKDVLNPGGGYNKGTAFSLIDEVRMVNGNYQDGYSPYNVFGCSVHWFQEHPTFRNGGLVAVSAYEHGTRLFQVTPEGKIVQQGYALPVAGAASAPHWHPDGKVFYTPDYQRGVDIWRYTGETYQGPPDAKAGGAPAKGSTPAPGAGALELMVTAAKSTRKAFLKKGLTLKVTCSRTCDVKGTVSSGRTKVATLRKAGGEGTFTIAVKPSKKAASKLRRAKRLKLKLKLTATAKDGRSATAVRTIKLK